MTESEGEAIRRAWDEWTELEPWQAKILQCIERADRGDRMMFVPRSPMHGKSWTLRYMTEHEFKATVVDLP